MFNTKQATMACILACVSIYSNLATAANATIPASLTAAAAKVPKAPETPPVDASIGAITDLSRQLKVAELQKQLREARAVAAPPALAATPSTPLGGFAVPKFTPIQPQPAIQSISSIGGKFSAVSTEGRPLVVGSQISLGDSTWKVTSITAYEVAFEKCVGRKCTPVNLAVGR